MNVDDTLAQWLHQRFGTKGVYAQSWNFLSDADRAYWEHEAAAVRRAVARGGFKNTTPPCHCGQPIPSTRTAYCSDACLLADQNHGPDEDGGAS